MTEVNILNIVTVPRCSMLFRGVPSKNVEHLNIQLDPNRRMVAGLPRMLEHTCRVFKSYK